MNEKFYNLSLEKQQKIRNAGFRVFSQNSYKKSPMSEIADAAGMLRGVAQMPPLDGLRDLKQNGDSFTFLYSGGIRALAQSLSKLPLTDLTVTEPDLEEVFLHYYTKEEG